MSCYLTDQELVEELCEIDHGLSDWEVGFVDSLSRWLDENDSLTDRQREKAEQIYEEKA